MGVIFIPSGYNASSAAPLLIAFCCSACVLSYRLPVFALAVRVFRWFGKVPLMALLVPHTPHDSRGKTCRFLVVLLADYRIAFFHLLPRADFLSLTNQWS